MRAEALRSFAGRSVLAFACLFLAAGAAEPNGTRYYVSASGDDAALGTSADSAWRTLERVSQQELGAGDEVLFQAGDRFVGQFQVGGSGSKARPLRIGRYGEGARPVLDGGSTKGGAPSSVILLRNRQHVEIADLEVINTIDDPRPGTPPDRAFGIHIINDRGGELAHFRLARLRIHDIFAKAIDHSDEDAFNRVLVSAIRFEVKRQGNRTAPSFFRDVLIENNEIARTGRFGVNIGHAGRGPGPRDAHTRDPDTGFNRDVVIRSNRFTDTGGSAVLLGGARFALIEDNDFVRTGSSAEPDRMVGRGSGAWVINSRDVVAQRNRSRSVRGYKDSYGMHVDFGNRDVLYQYNLSEDSEGGFIEILGNNRNVIWRYNVSINDGLREKDGNTIWLSPWSPGQVRSEGIYLYNNTVYVRPGLYPDLDFRAKGAHIWNNLFSVGRQGMIGESMRVELDGGTLDLAGNMFSGKVNAAFQALDRQPRSGAPRFAMPGSVEPDGYRIAPGSPAANGGVPVVHPRFPAAGQGVFAHIREVPESDFFGTPLPRGAPSVGAAEP